MGWGWSICLHCTFPAPRRFPPAECMIRRHNEVEQNRRIHSMSGGPRVVYLCPCGNSLCLLLHGLYAMSPRVLNCALFAHQASANIGRLKIEKMHSTNRLWLPFVLNVSFNFNPTSAQLQRYHLQILICAVFVLQSFHLALAVLQHESTWFDY